MYLANHLKELTRDGRVSTDAQLQTAFADFEEVQRPRAEFLMRAAHSIARMESLDTAVRSFLMLRFLGKIPEKFLFPFLAEACLPAARLTYLPSPPRRSFVSVLGDGRPGQPRFGCACLSLLDLFSSFYLEAKQLLISC